MDDTKDGVKDLWKEPPLAPTLDKNAREEALANLLVNALEGEVKCVGQDSYLYQKGTFRLTPRWMLLRRALEIQHPESREARIAENVVRHVEYQHQVEESELGGFNRFADDDPDAPAAVLIN